MPEVPEPAPPVPLPPTPPEPIPEPPVPPDPLVPQADWPALFKKTAVEPVEQPKARYPPLQRRGDVAAALAAAATRRSASYDIAPIAHVPLEPRAAVAEWKDDVVTIHSGPQAPFLVRQEVALAQVELTNKATEVGKNVGYLAVGGAIGYAGFLAVLAGVVMILSYVVPLWAAALIVGVIVGITAYFLVSSAVAELKKTELAPRETVESIKEDAQWLRDQMT